MKNSKNILNKSHGSRNHSQLYGSELLVGFQDCIVDIVETGEIFETKWFRS